MTNQATEFAPTYEWQPQPEVGRYVADLVASFVATSPAIRDFRERLLTETGTRLADWIDHFVLPAGGGLGDRLGSLGFVAEDHARGQIWTHPLGMFPPICLLEQEERMLCVKVESVCDFLFANRLDERAPIEGSPHARLRKALISAHAAHELWVVERHGVLGPDVVEPTGEQAQAAAVHGEAFLRRCRMFHDEPAAFHHAMERIGAAVDDLDVNWACDLFFAAERAYWQSRNRAAGIQKSRQDRLGLGWANHDHHTFRASREHFARLIAVLEALGMTCRERFYAGPEAGWGAQVLEQSHCGIVVFADVDLAAEEIAGDFAHEPLPDADQLGTVGLWCKLHGDSLLQGGMHHLECQFDFDAARDQLRAAGIETMPPFTNFDYLKQAFTQGEPWPVDARRIDAALSAGLITAEQAERFRRDGAIGSHLEILQRDQGYKGFDQTGVSDIIRRVDPRK